MKSFSFRAFAKLNLYLKVLNKRKDNYHNLITIFERISLSDRISIKERADSQIKISSNFKEICPPNANLVFQAAEFLRKDLKINKGIDIHIEKRIPLASGLGGGSSDAAATLLGLNKLWNLGLDLDKLLKYACRLGADVSFFLYDTSFAIGRKKGEQIQPLDISNCFWHLLILPNIKVFSKEVYLELDSKGYFSKLTNYLQDVKIITYGLKEKNIPQVEGKIFNQLEEIALMLYPQLKTIKNTLKKIGLKNVFMSGSGPAMFTIFSSKKEAQWFRQRLRDKQDRGLFKVVLAKTI